MFKITLDPILFKSILSTIENDISIEVQNIILENLQDQIEDMIKILQIVCTDKICTNELRRVIALKYMKLCC